MEFMETFIRTSQFVKGVKKMSYVEKMEFMEVLTKD